MPALEEVEIENFKSFREWVVVRFKQFSSIFGHNGAGKSCLVDAIKFAFCFSPYDRMPVESLREEICNKSGKDFPSSWVKIKLNTNEDIKIIQRSMDYDEMKIKYFIDDVEVDKKEYKNYLLNFNINPIANNMFIEQNMTENFLMMDPKERTVFFEQLCDSASYKSEYVKVLKALKEISSKKKNLQSEKNYFIKTKKALKNMATETKTHDELASKLVELEFSYYYALLYEIDTTIDKSLEEQAKSKKNIQVIEKLKKATEVQIFKLKSDIEQKSKDLETLDDKVQQRNEKIEEHLNEMLQLNQKITVAKGNVTKLKANLKQAKKIDEAHEKTIEDLESQLRQVEEDKETLTRSQGPTYSIQLEDQKYTEYLELKSKSQVESAKEISLLNSIERQKEAINDRIDDCNRKKELLVERIKRQQLECEDLDKQISRIEQNIQETELSERDRQEKCQNMIERSEVLMKNIEILKEQIDALNLQLQNCKESAYESQKSKKQQEVLHTLQCNFKGVEDRLKNLCNVSEERYQVAITKLMGNKMDAIVVDTVETAKNCIKFLQCKHQGEKFSVIETFLPMNYVKIKSLDEVLKVEKNIQNIKIALFVMCSVSKQVQKIVHHVLGDTMICETDDEALQISKTYKINCVSLSGTLFKKNGIISGGLANILEKSKQWTDKDKEYIKYQKETKLTSFRKMQIELREMQGSLSEVSVELVTFNKKLENHLLPLLKEKQQLSEKKKKELATFKENLTNFDNIHNLKELQKEWRIINNKCEQIESQKNKIEDAVFKQFCSNLQIPNIRVYEQGDFKKRQNRINKETEYDNLIDQIKNQIKFEKERDTKITIEKLESRIERETENFDNINKKKDKLNTLIENRKRSTNHDQLIAIKKNIEELKKKLKSEENKYKLMTADLKEHKSNVSANTARILNMRADKHELLMECKMKNLEIPLHDGTINKILLKTGIDTTLKNSTTESSTDQNESQLKEKYLEINYARLPESIKSNVNKSVRNLKEKIDTVRKDLDEILEYINAVEDLKDVDKRLQIINKDCNKTDEKIKALRNKFENVKHARSSLFKKFVNSLQEHVERVYKDIYNDESAQTLIVMRNPDEPFLQGIEFDCVIPGKPFIPIDNISGAEKAICALSMLIGIHRLKPSPCLIFDEIDAAIDSINQAKLYSYLENFKLSTQIIIISHRISVNFYADAAINIRESIYHTSAFLHVDITKYLKHLVDKFSKSSVDQKALCLRRKKGDISASTPKSFTHRAISTSSSKRTEESLKLPTISTISDISSKRTEEESDKSGK